MNIIYVLIPLAILLVCLAIGVFFWAVRNNQFDDLERHGQSILFDDDLPAARQSNKTAEQITADTPESNVKVSTTHPSDHE
ncbi:MAG: cbb3-type cytochrome oxidase assembly protein CcoS [Paraglaciecola sp.]|nr:cbb3-type cytochrome oxidase assembly protein CcoS [Paraglaciecola sp.]NCT47790.1 cbb3-type cytochrome oxidase assembly protein CcoS [Paraglaciecola sp.]